MQSENEAMVEATNWSEQYVAGSMAERREAALSLAELLLKLQPQLTDKEVYWLGVKAGVERHSYVVSGVRYVGVGVVSLHAAMLQVDEDMREALSEKSSS